MKNCNTCSTRYHCDGEHKFNCKEDNSYLYYAEDSSKIKELENLNDDYSSSTLVDLIDMLKQRIGDSMRADFTLQGIMICSKGYDEVRDSLIQFLKESDAKKSQKKMVSNKKNGKILRISKPGRHHIAEEIDRSSRF